MHTLSRLHRASVSDDNRTAQAVFLNATRSARTAGFAWAWAGLGAASIRTENWEQADGALRHASTLDENSASVWASTALLALKAKPASPPEAERSVIRALACGLNSAAVLEELYEEFSNSDQPEVATLVAERQESLAQW